jgi:DNA-binding response OmpR family regulator
MNERRDRLGGMVGRGGADRPKATLEPGARTVLRRRALLFAPPPAPAGAYVQLLEAEGYDVLVALDPPAAEALIRSAPPKLVLAVAPTLGPELIEAWRALAPEADVRVLPGFSALLEERIAAPGELAEFAARGFSALSALLSSARGAPTPRSAEVARLADAAARALGLPAADAMTVRLWAALYEIPEHLGLAEVPSAPASHGDGPDDRNRILAEFARGLASPFPIGADPPPGPSEARAPVPGEVVEAVVRFVLLKEAGEKDPVLALRREAAGERPLHPAAVEAVVATSREEEGARGTLLLADPDAPARNVLALRLRNEGYAVRTVGDGRAALEEVRRERPGLILAEAVLPGLDGFALLDSLKQEGRGTIPFVFLSSRSDSLSVNKGLLLGASDYLGKPVNVEVLLTKLEKILGRGIEAREASSRLSLSDLSMGAAATYPTVTFEELQPGVLLMGRFRIQAELGEGAMGKVFKALDERLEEVVVLKVMKIPLGGDTRVLELFKREIRLARKITHTGVVRIHDFWEAGPLSFVTMEYLEGQDLSLAIKKRGAFPVPVAVRVAGELFEALAAAHAVGVVHRDIKPHNVLLLPTGQIKVLDFGIAQGLEASAPDVRTLSGTIVGTPAYMSPEQILGERVDARTDLYSAGVVFYEVLTGDVPFRGENSMATVTMHLNTPAPPPSERNASVTPALDAVVLRLLAKDRRQRPAEAREVASELRALKR